MKKTTQFLLLALAFVFSSNAFAQSTVTGIVMDSELNAPLPGANILEKGTSNGVSTDFDGNFTLNTSASSGEIVISYVGYGSVTLSFNGDTDLGTISLSPDNTLEEIVVVGSGVIDLAEDRKPTIAVSTVKAAEIQQKAGNWDLPEILKSTPGVQNIKGGGFGDGSMFLRGFDQSNTAFMLNGQPINSPEDGRMFWSNWSGVLDVANAVQVQRGLGSSKLAISSVGGTVNIVTKTVDRKQGGFVQQMIGNNNFTKTSVYYSTGLMENGWAFSTMLGHWQGEGYVNYTDGQGQTYLISVGYKSNENNLFNFLITGAPQWHAAAGRGDIIDFLENGRRWNDWNYGGVDSPNLLNGGRYPGGRNVYHKPVANLSWDWDITENSKLSTVLYGSLGRGTFAFTIDDRADNPTALYARGSNNNHNWYGLVSNFNTQLNDNLDLNFGADVRLYNGIHFRSVNEFLSVNSVTGTNNSNSNVNTLTEVFGGINPWDLTFNPNDDNSQRFGYDYEEQINYVGAFGQLEYSNDNLSAFFQGSVSTQSHVRTEFKEVQVAGRSEESEKVNNPGFNLKAGAPYTLSDNHKVFANVGYYSRQPFHSDLFLSDRNGNDLINPEVENQKITGLEAGYQFGSDKVSFNLNLYHTTWDNVTRLGDNGENQGTPDFRLFQTQNVKQVHSGIELEVFTRLADNLRINGFVSIGNWEFDGNGSQRTFDESGTETDPATEVNLDGVKVGGAAQFTAGLSGSYEFLPRLSVDGTWNLYNNLYSQGNTTADSPPIELPNYDTVDTGISYKWMVGSEKDKSIQFRANINNLFCDVYRE
jgi:outer membrane cobalamin receptor